MAKAPELQPVAGADVPNIIDIYPARVDLIIDADVKAHGATAGWGGPGNWIGLYLTEGQAAEVMIRVPPSVTDVDLVFMVTGTGKVTVTSSADSTGTELEWALASENVVTSAAQVGTGGPLPTSAGAASGRAVTVRAAVAWTWIDETLTITSASAGGEDGAIFGVLVSPFYEAK